MYYIVLYCIVLYYITLYYIILMILHVLMISISICIPGCGSWPRKVDAWKHNWTNFGGFIPSPDFRSAWPSGWIDATHPGRYHQATKSMSCQVTCGSCRSTFLKRDPWVSYQPASQMQAKRRTWKRRRSRGFRCETSGSFKDPVKTKFRLVMVYFWIPLGGLKLLTHTQACLTFWVSPGEKMWPWWLNFRCFHWFWVSLSLL